MDVNADLQENVSEENKFNNVSEENRSENVSEENVSEENVSELSNAKVTIIPADQMDKIALSQVQMPNVNQDQQKIEIFKKIYAYLEFSRSKGAYNLNDTNLIWNSAMNFDLKDFKNQKNVGCLSTFRSALDVSCKQGFLKFEEVSEICKYFEILSS